MQNGGRLKFTDQQVAFKNVKTGKLDSFACDRVNSAKWVRLAAMPGLALTLNDGQLYRFGGFKEDVRSFASA